MTTRERAAAVAAQAPLPSPNQLTVLRGLLGPELSRLRRERRQSAAEGVDLDD